METIVADFELLTEATTPLEVFSQWQGTLFCSTLNTTL
jgi:hypothetical protein